MLQQEGAAVGTIGRPAGPLRVGRADQCGLSSDDLLSTTLAFIARVFLLHCKSHLLCVVAGAGKEGYRQLIDSKSESASDIE
jgi:hypothetical protein